MTVKPETYIKLAIKDMIIEPCDGGYSAHHDLLKGVLAFGSSVDDCIEDYEAAVAQWCIVHTQKGRTLPDLTAYLEPKFG